MVAPSVSAPSSGPPTSGAPSAGAPGASSGASSPPRPADAARHEARHYWISGHVQGVSYRAMMRREAERLGLAGWVRNLMDGRVEAMAEGDPHALDKLESWCRAGPPGSRVDRIRVEPHPGGVVHPHGPFIVRRE